MKQYTQLTQEQRYQIYILMKACHTQTEIAVLLGVRLFKTLCQFNVKHPGTDPVGPQNESPVARA